MATEIERKFLLQGDGWRGLAPGKHYRQGYLSTVAARTVRVRVIEDSGYLTINGATSNATRAEYEYVIPVEDAHAMLDTLCERPLIEKTRYLARHAGFEWEIDVFEGDNRGLVIAEVELPSADTHVTLPEWVGMEVSDDLRYYNVSLQKHPYCTW